MPKLAYLFVSLLLSCGVPAATPKTELTDEQFARQLLTDWLVRRDLDTVRAQMAPDFFIKPGLRDPDVWPKALQSLPERERVLRFPFACDNAPAACRKLSDCVKAMEGSGDFDLEQTTVDDDMVRANPELRARAGHHVIILSVMLKGCGIGAAMTVDKTDQRRIVSVLYIVG